MAVIFVDTGKLEDVIEMYRDIRKKSNNEVEDNLTRDCSKCSKVEKIPEQIKKIVNTLQTYRATTMKERVENFNDKKKDFEKAVDKIKNTIFKSYEKNVQEQNSDKIGSSLIDSVQVSQDALIQVDEKDLPQVWSASEKENELIKGAVLNNVFSTGDEQTKFMELVNTLQGKYNMDLITAVQISSYMITIVLPAVYSTQMLMVQVYLDIPEQFEKNFGFSMYNINGAGEVQINEIGWIQGFLDETIQEFINSKGTTTFTQVELSELFNDISGNISEKFNDYYVNQKMGVVQKIKLEESETFSSNTLSEYSTAKLGEIAKQVSLSGVPARVEFSPNSGLTLSGMNEEGYYDVILDEPVTFALLGGDEEELSLFGMGDFYRVKLEDLEMTEAPFNIRYSA